ncbi:PDZ domain-containing protein GIPC3-like isoform X2 [Convolutriloba macropyga]
MSSVMNKFRKPESTAMTLNANEVENEPFLDEQERAANNQVEYPTNAPKAYTPGKQTNDSVFQQGILGIFGAPKKLEFSVQLANGSAVKKVTNFKSVKELYDRVAEAFPEEVDSAAEVMFCTLNSHTIHKNLENLLGGQIMLTDFIYVHLKSRMKKRVIVNKADSALGLTITDNGVGVAFIKRIREGSIISRLSNVKVGDHIESINDQSTVGWRHFEVAKKLRAIPVGHQFSMTLVEPMKSEFDNIAPRSSRGGSAGSGGNAMGTISAAGDMAALGDGMQSIRFKAGGTAEYVEELPTDFIQAAQILIDDELETYMGIRDSALSSDILDFWTSAEDPDQFATSLDNHLGEGIIPDDAIFRIDEALGKLKSQFK